LNVYVAFFPLIFSLPSLARGLSSVLASMERGTLRSGKRFAARNRPFYSTLRELFQHHPRLLSTVPAVSTEVLRIGNGRQGNLLQTTVRFRSDHPTIYHDLRQVFLELFREHTENSTDGFEVVTVFNAILTNSDRSTFSVFYGHDYSTDNSTGAATELRHGRSPVIVRSLANVKAVPTVFNLEEVVLEHRLAFEQSNVVIDRILNVVYLIRRLLAPEPERKRKSRSSPKERVAPPGGKKNAVPPARKVSRVPRNTMEGQRSFSVKAAPR